MKTLSTTLLAVTLTVFIGTTARAGGIPVIDVAHIVESVKQLIQMKEAYDKQKEQLEQAVKEVEALTGHNGIGDLLNSPIYRDARRYTPTTWQDTMRILKAGGLPGSAADVRKTYEDLNDTYKIASGEEYNPLNKDAANAIAHERQRDTNFASMAIAEKSFNQTAQRVVNYESLMGQIESTPDMKAAADLLARIAAENGVSISEMIRLQTVALQQEAARQNQELVAASSLARMLQYEGKRIEDIPTE